MAQPSPAPISTRYPGRSRQLPLRQTRRAIRPHPMGNRRPPTSPRCRPAPATPSTPPNLPKLQKSLPPPQITKILFKKMLQTSRRPSPIRPLKDPPTAPMPILNPNPKCPIPRPLNPKNHLSPEKAEFGLQDAPPSNLARLLRCKALGQLQLVANQFQLSIAATNRLVASRNPAKLVMARNHRHALLQISRRKLGAKKHRKSLDSGRSRFWRRPAGSLLPARGPSSA